MTAKDLERRVALLERALGELLHQPHSRDDAAHYRRTGKAGLADVLDAYEKGLPPESEAPRVLWSTPI